MIYCPGPYIADIGPVGVQLLTMIARTALYWVSDPPGATPVAAAPLVPLPQALLAAAAAISVLAADLH